jgi:hypothetical protein
MGEEQWHGECEYEEWWDEVVIQGVLAVYP